MSLVPIDQIKDNATKVAKQGTPVSALQPKGWYWARLDGTKWDKYYPYQILVVRKTETGYVKEPGWTFTLPCPPESLQMSMPFASSVAVTLDGAVEDDNGAPIRDIVVSGTFGVNPARGTGIVTSNDNALFSTIYGGTITQAQQTWAAAKDVATSQNGTSSFWKRNLHQDSDFGPGGNLEQYTGYYQWRLFSMFMEGVAELKKKVANRALRLAFAVWKEDAVYLVTPRTLEVRKTSASGLEYLYTLAMRATGRVRLGQVQPEIARAGKRQPTMALTSLMTSVDACRKVLVEVGRLPQALSNDVKALGIEPLRELTFFAKDALALPLSFADTADSFVSAAKWAIIDALTTYQAGKNLTQNIVDRYKRSGKKAKEALELIDQASAERRDTVTENPALSAHPVNSLFSDPTTIYDLLSSVSVGDFPLSPQLTSRLQEERNRIRGYGVSELREISAKLQFLLQLVSDALGTADSVYDETYGSSHSNTAKVPNDEDFEVMYALNQVIVDLKSVIAARTDTNNRLLTTLEYIAGLAQRSGIAFTVPVSKFAVPFPYGSTLESIALRYLGDPDRWHEIAALNGLQQPYIDEEGFEQRLLVNGDADTLIVAEASQYYVGQSVWVGSRYKPRTKRHLVKIVHISPSQHLLVVDGERDMNQYLVSADATIHAFLPNTINSQMQLYIPSGSVPGQSDFQTNQIPGVDEYEQLIAVGGVDILLDSTNDLVLSPDGGDRWAVGLTNIVQKVRLTMATPKGSLLDHPDFGNAIRVGQSIADLDPNEAIEAVRTMFAEDPSFSAVKGVKLEVQGPVARFGVALEVAGTSQIVPVSVEIKQ